MDGELCFMLDKTPSQIYELEEEGYLSYEEKVFLWAFSSWRTNFCLENRVSLL